MGFDVGSAHNAFVRVVQTYRRRCLAWVLLESKQQAQIPRVKFLNCGGMPVALTDVSLSVVGDPYEEETTIPGQNVPFNSSNGAPHCENGRERANPESDGSRRRREW